MAGERPLLGFLWLALLLSVTNAWYNESELMQLYMDAEELYWDASYHWDFGQGYSEMKGAPGMAVCFVEGPEREALVLGGGQNSTNATIELQENMEGPQLSNPAAFTVSLWYSFRPVNFYDEVNHTMTCDLLSFKEGDQEIRIAYNGMEEYNLTYGVGIGSELVKIVDDKERPGWEFEVNDTIHGRTIWRGWQWNHVAMVYQDNSLKAYFNGQRLNVTATGQLSETLTWGNVAGILKLNDKHDDKCACAPVGFDEVALWSQALSDRDILALRVHVGRNRSLDRPEPTTEMPSTALPTTTGLGSSTGAGSTDDQTSPAATTKPATTGQEATSRPDTTSQTTGATTLSQDTTNGQSSPTDGTTSGSGGGGGPSQMPGGTTASGSQTSSATTSSSTASSTSSPSSSDQATTRSQTTGGAGATTKSPQHLEIENALAELNVSAGVGSVSQTLTTISKALNEDQSPTDAMTSSVVEVLALSAQATDGTSEEKNLFRQDFVNLTSDLVAIIDETVNSAVSSTLVSAVEQFLDNFVNDPAVTKETITSPSMEVSVFPVDGSTVRTSDNVTLQVPTDAFTNATDMKVVMCIIRDSHLFPPQQNSVESTQQFNLSSAIIILKTTGSSGSVSLDNPVTFTTTTYTCAGVPLCSYWCESSHWCTDGVTTLGINPDTCLTTCETNHMTNFAVLMSVDGVELEGAHAMALSVISYIGCALSLACLTLALIIFIILRELNSTRMGIVKNLCVALFLAQLLFVAGIQTATANEIACKAVAAMLHYLFLCVIAWMLCNGIYLYQKVNSAAKPGGVVDLIYFCILGWGAPAVVVAVTAGVNHKVYGSAELCWLTVEGSGIWAFVIPAMLIILFNAFVTFLTMKAFVSVKVFKDKTDKDKFKSGLRAIIVMLPILGLSWIFGLLAFGEAGIFFQYLFAIFNSLQGVFLFIFHVFLNEEVKGGMRRRFGKVGASGEENTLFNKIWAFSGTSNAERSTQMSSVTQTESLSAKPAYKN